jgi:3-phenylpropionate/trans-cinnamate dioxygenase ferredoxin reductase subunit
VPWFWTDQGPLKLQIAGLSAPGGEYAVRGDPSGTTFSVFSFVDGRLACVESLNSPADHMLARRLLTKGAELTPQQAADAGFDLKSLV